MKNYIKMINSRRECMRKFKSKHSKIRNTGLLYEFLLRQVTADVLDKKANSVAVSILKKNFNENTNLGKELALYNVIVNKKFTSDKKAEYFINEVLKERNKINNTNLKINDIENVDKRRIEIGLPPLYYDYLIYGSNLPNDYMINEKKFYEIINSKVKDL